MQTRASLRQRLSRGLFVAGSSFLFACPAPGKGPVGPATPTPPPSAEALYQASIQDAKEAKPEEIYKQLVAIRPETQGLRWSPDKSKVLVAIFTNWDGYQMALDQGGALTLAREVWVTPSPWLQSFCQQSKLKEPELTARVLQRLGLPPEDKKDRVAEIWVTPKDLFRPCPDAEIDDAACELDFPASTTPEHRAWIENLSGKSYGDPGYPWTRLGYTYDWVYSVESGKTKHIGESEFVARPGAVVKVERVTSLASYCGQN
jgi:hypothetical protein